MKSELEKALGKRPPFGVVDAPAKDTATGQSLKVAGWVLDTQKIDTVSVELDGTVVKTLPVNVQRPDVCAVYPMYTGCPAVGYSGDVAVGNLGGCPHLLRVVAKDGDGNQSVLGERVLTAQ